MNTVPTKRWPLVAFTKQYLTAPNTDFIILTESEHVSFFRDRMNLSTDNTIASNSIATIKINN